MKHTFIQTRKRAFFGTGFWKLRKLCVITAISLCLTLASYGQTQKQIDLVSSFFDSYGAYTLQDMAHPISTCIGTSVDAHSDNIYFITIEYKSGSQYFTCEYRLSIDNTGHFLRLSIYRCGDKGGCFMGCRLLADFDKVTSDYNKDRYERYLGKSLGNMSCEEYTLVKLYYRWVDKNYYDKY